MKHDQGQPTRPASPEQVDKQQLGRRVTSTHQIDDNKDDLGRSVNESEKAEAPRPTKDN